MKCARCEMGEDAARDPSTPVLRKMQGVWGPQHGRGPKNPRGDLRASVFSVQHVK